MIAEASVHALQTPVLQSIQTLQFECWTRRIPASPYSKCVFMQCRPLTSRFQHLMPNNVKSTTNTSQILSKQESVNIMPSQKPLRSDFAGLHGTLGTRSHTSVRQPLYVSRSDASPEVMLG